MGPYVHPQKKLSALAQSLQLGFKVSGPNVGP